MSDNTTSKPPTDGFKDPANMFPDKLGLFYQQGAISPLATTDQVIVPNTYVAKRLAARTVRIPVTNTEYQLQGKEELTKDEQSHYSDPLTRPSVKNFTNYWDEPLPAFCAAYPYNEVRQTQSGHVQEFDNTPGAERINLQHATGNYSEWDREGNSANKVGGDYYNIIHRNRFEYVKGDSFLTVDGTVHLLVNGDIHLECNGDMFETIRGDVKTYISGDRITEIAGTDTTLVHDEIKLSTTDKINISSKNAMSFSNESGNITMTSKTNVDIAGDNIYLNCREPDYKHPPLRRPMSPIRSKQLPKIPVMPKNITKHIADKKLVDDFSKDLDKKEVPPSATPAVLDPTDKLYKVHPDLVKLVNYLREEVPKTETLYQFTVISGFRTREKQDQLIAAGKTNAKNSRHLTRTRGRFWIVR